MQLLDSLFFSLLTCNPQKNQCHQTKSNYRVELNWQQKNISSVVCLVIKKKKIFFLLEYVGKIVVE